jgi:signal transduction histidine kinase
MSERNNGQILVVHDIRDKILWAIRVRYAIVILSVAIMCFAFYNRLDIGLSLVLVPFVAAYNFAAHIIYRSRKTYYLWQIIILRSVFQVFDVLAITFLVYITGGLESPYWFLYLVLIVISGFGAYSYAAFSVFLIAIFSAIFYLGLLLLTYQGVIPTYGPGFMLSPQELLRSIFNKAVFTTVSFFLFAATIYYFTKLIGEQRQQLSQKNKELLAALSELKDLDRLKDEFISNASHELRTPLSVIRENVSLVSDGIVGSVSEKQRKLLMSSQANVDRLAHILDNMLDISKIESRMLALNRQHADLCEVAAKANELFEKKAQDKKISVETRFPGKVIAWFDPDQIMRVFINLLDNAIKFTGEGGVVMVGVEVSPREVRGYVRDDGIGIAGEDRARIFDRFIRVDADGMVGRRGAGLGLSICKGIIEMHNGRVWVESDLGKGSRFVFALPRVEVNE